MSGRLAEIDVGWGGWAYRPSSWLRSPWRFSSRWGAARVVARRAGRRRRRGVRRMVFGGSVDVTLIVPIRFQVFLRRKRMELPTD